MASPTSHRKFVGKQGPKQIFQVLCLKKLGLKHSFMLIMQEIFELRGATRKVISHEEMPRIEKVCLALFWWLIWGEEEREWLFHFYWKAIQNTYWMHVILHSDADVNWCKQGGITSVLLWEMLYSTPFWHWSSGRKSSLCDLAGKDGHSLMGKQ